MTRALLTDATPDELLRQAQEAAYRLPSGFDGFTATLTCSDDAVEATATVQISGPGELQFTFDADPPDGLRQSAQRELASMVGHRWAHSYEEGDGRYGKRLDPEEGPSTGRLVILEGDPFSSSYRVAGGQVVQVNRTMGAIRFSIVIHGRTLAPDGRFLPAQFSVYHWAVDTGRLTRADSFSDTYVEVGGVMLPGARRVVSAQDEGISHRDIVLSSHSLLDGGRP